MVQQMLKRVIQWLKNFFQSLFGKKQRSSQVKRDVETTVAPPLTDTDLEFLFTELLAGVHQARGQTWVQNWFNKIEHRVTTERWLEWLRRFGDRLLASKTQNNELASRLVQLGELDVGKVGDMAYQIGMEVLTSSPGEPIWEYDGPDALSLITTDENFSEEEYQTVTWDELLLMLQENDTLRHQIAQDWGMDTDDPQIIIQTLINQSQTFDESPPSEN